jgi:hypothetical protein
MREQGYVDRKDFIVEYRGAEGRHARIPEFRRTRASEG